MKVFADADKLQQQLAAKIAQKTKGLTFKSPYKEEKDPSTVEDATQHAQAYWMLGWTWEEIETILEDMEFSPKTISKAIKSAQEYAAEVLKDGPFSSIKEGQYIQLKNGYTGRVKHIYKDHLCVQCEKDAITVSASDIDMHTSERLEQAYALRDASKKLMKEAQKVDVPGAEPAELEITPQEQFKLRLTPQMQVPKTWKPYLPEKFVDIEEASASVEQFGQAILTLEEQIKQVKEEEAIAKKMYMEQKDVVKGMEREQQEIAKQVGSILGIESKASDDLVDAAIRRFGDTIIGWRQLIERTDPIPPGLVDKHNELIRLVQEKMPEIFDEIMEALGSWEKANSYIIETLKTEVGVAKPPPKMLKGQKSTWEKIKQWFSGLWNNVKTTTDALYQRTFPALDELTNEIDMFIHDVEAQTTASKIRGALRVRATD